MTSQMRREADETPEVVARLATRMAPALAALTGPLRAARLVTTAARGSSDHAASVFKVLMELGCGVPVASIGPSVASVYDRPLRLDGAVHVTVSQSGVSPDILALQAAARRGGAVTVAVVNVEDSPLARGADVVIGLGAGPEHSVAATKSCIASVAALAGLAVAAGAGGGLAEGLARLPQALAATTPEVDGKAVDLLAGVASLYVAGRGPGFGIAQEAALKAKETAAIHAEAFSLAEVMHGPARLVGAGFPVAAFVANDAARPGSLAALDRLAAMGAPVLALSSAPVPGAAVTIGLPETGCGWLDPVVGLLAWYRLIEAVARARGHDPDRPPYLRKVTETL